MSNTETTTEKALKAKAEAEGLVQSAIKEQLEIIKDAQKTLTRLGYTDGVEGGGKKPTTKKRAVENKDCEICGFQTTPSHTNRHHRTQAKNKKAPFTAKELEAKGLKKV